MAPIAMVCGPGNGDPLSLDQLFTDDVRSSLDNEGTPYSVHTHVEYGVLKMRSVVRECRTAIPWFKAAKRPGPAMPRH